MYPKVIEEILEKEHKNNPTLIQERSYEALENGASLVG